VVDGRHAFGPQEKEQFRQFCTEYTAFCGVRLLTWCVLDNHFHLLVEVPAKPAELPTTEFLLKRLEHLTGTALSAAATRQRIDLWRQQNNAAAEEAWRGRQWRQMQNISQFMKLLKQRFSQWFNRRHQRRGTLWESRFGSVLVEGIGPAVAAMAAYLDLNPVRAGLVDDPKDYRWCGYAEAMVGQAEAQAGLATSLGTTVELVLPEYRVWLFGQGEEREGTDAAGRPLRRGLPREKVLAVVAAGGKVSLPELLQVRIRYLVAGAVLGSREFVNQIFQLNRSRFGPNRRDGARRIRGLVGSPLWCLRALRRRPLG